MSNLPPPPGGAEPGAGFAADPKMAKAQAKAAKAHAKAVRPWYKKKRFILGGIVGLFVVIALASGGGEDGGDGGQTASPSSATNTGQSGQASGAEGKEPGGQAAADTTGAPEPEVVEVSCTPENGLGPGDTKRQGLFPDRTDVQVEDHEAEIGSCVRLSGYTAFVLGGSIQPQSFGDPQIVIEVKVLNRDDSAQSFSMFDWSIQTPSGTVVDPTIYFGDGQLDSGSLVKGGEATGKIAFDQNQPGTYFVIYKPDMFDSARGIWKLEL